MNDEQRRMASFAGAALQSDTPQIKGGPEASLYTIPEGTVLFT